MKKVKPSAKAATMQVARGNVIVISMRLSSGAAWLPTPVLDKNVEIKVGISAEGLHSADAAQILCTYF